MTFGERILALRKQAGLSQEQLAEKLEVSRQSVSNWENGLATPDTENVLRMSRLFGVSADRLFGEPEDLPPDGFLNSPEEDAPEEGQKPAHETPNGTPDGDGQKQQKKLYLLFIESHYSTFNS